MKLIASIFFLAFFSSALHAAPCPDFQQVGTANISLCSTGNISATIGALSYNGVRSDIGMDLDVIHHSPSGMYAKIGIEEGLGNLYSPSFNIGISQAGIRTKHDFLQHQNIFHVMISKSYGKTVKGRAFFGAFHGNEVMGIDRKGFFIGYTQYLVPIINEGKVIYHKLAIDSVYTSGKSYMGGFTLLAKYYLTQKISIQTGPQWSFNNMTVEQSKWSFEKVKWLITLSIDL